MPFVQGFQSEVASLRDQVVDRFPEALELVTKYGLVTNQWWGRGEGRAKWHAMAYAVQHLENALLTSAVAAAKNHGLQVDALVFDGMMVRRRENATLGEELLRSIEREANARPGVARDHGLLVRLEEKPFLVSPEAQQWQTRAVARQRLS